MERWYVVETHARAEARALDHLGRRPAVPVPLDAVERAL